MILGALLAEPGMTFQEISNVEGNRNRNRARQRLDRLVRRGLVREEGRSEWRRGKKLVYSLTNKGRREYFRSNRIRAEERIRILKEAVREIDPVEAAVLLEGLGKYAEELIVFVDDIYKALPKNAELMGSTEERPRDKRANSEVF